MKIKISIGVVKRINLNIVAKCGGAVEKKIAMKLAVSLESMLQEKIQMINLKKKWHNLKTMILMRNVCVARNLVIKLKIVHEIQISKLL